MDTPAPVTEEYVKQFYIDLILAELQQASLQDIKLALAFIRT